MEQNIYVKVNTAEQLQAVFESRQADAVICGSSLCRQAGAAISGSSLCRQTEAAISEPSPYRQAGAAISEPSLYRRIAETSDYIAPDQVVPVKKEGMQIGFGTEQQPKVFLALPEILREGQAETGFESLWEGQSKTDPEILQNVQGVLIENIDALGWLQSISYEGSLIAGEFLYSYNSESIRLLQQLSRDAAFVSPPELTLQELQQLEKETNARFLYKVYGHQKLMITAQCLFKNHGNCSKTSKKRAKSASGKSYPPEWFGQHGAERVPFMDRGDNEQKGLITLNNQKWDRFFVTRNCEQCCNLIYNGRPTFLLDRLSEFAGRCLLLDFTIESADEVRAVLNQLQCALQGRTVHADFFTRGHYDSWID